MRIIRRYRSTDVKPLFSVDNTPTVHILTPVNGKKAGISASKISLRSLSGGYFKFLISKRSPEFLFFITGFLE